jgi:hypothetical protein
MCVTDPHSIRHWYLLDDYNAYTHINNHSHSHCHTASHAQASGGVWLCTKTNAPPELPHRCLATATPTASLTPIPTSTHSPTQTVLPTGTVSATHRTIHTFSPWPSPIVWCDVLAWLPEPHLTKKLSNFLLSFALSTGHLLSFSPSIFNAQNILILLSAEGQQIDG